MAISIYLCPPRQPDLEDVVAATALDSFVAGIVVCVVLLILLEQVLGTHRVTLLQFPLVTNAQVVNDSLKILTGFRGQV